MMKALWGRESQFYPLFNFALLLGHTADAGASLRDSFRPTISNTAAPAMTLARHQVDSTASTCRDEFSTSRLFDQPGLVRPRPGATPSTYFSVPNTATASRPLADNDANAGATITTPPSPNLYHMATAFRRQLRHAHTPGANARRSTRQITPSASLRRPGTVVDASVIGSSSRGQDGHRRRAGSLPARRRRG